MLLTGTFERTVDERNRFAVPKRIRDCFGGATGAIYLAPGTDGSLSLFTEASFSRLAEQLAHGSPTAQDVRAFSRLFYAQAERMEIDKQGRVRIPSELVRLASLGKEIVLIGVGDHLEIWDKQAWETYLLATQPSYDQLAERAFNPQPTNTKTLDAVSNDPAPRPQQPR